MATWESVPVTRIAHSSMVMMSLLRIPIYTILSMVKDQPV